jgi:hypothetical protein
MSSLQGCYPTSYTRVFEYEEGKQDWMEAGLPVDESGS